MNTQDLADAIGAKHGLSKSDSRGVVDDVLATIAASLAKGEDIALNGFGKFTVKDTPAREGRNPATGEAMQIAAGKKIGFTAAKALKDKVVNG